MDAMRELQNHPHLAGSARHALETLVTHHADIQQARADIDDYLKETAHAFKMHQNLRDIAQRFSSLDVRLQDISNYTDWKERAEKLVDAGHAILDDRERYGIHLHEHPETTRRIETDVQRLNAALGRDDTSISHERHQFPSEDEKTAEPRSQRHGIKP